jgi:hypothetical protein
MATLVRKTMLVTGAIAVLALPACAVLSTSANLPGIATASPAPSGSLLPRDVVVAPPDVQSVFPELTTETDMGWNPTASGNPLATRSVAFTNGDGSKKVTISVDAYANPSVPASRLCRCRAWESRLSQEA